jgi:hypothetical protein
MAYDSDGTGETTTAGRSAPATSIGGSASAGTSAGESDGSRSNAQSDAAAVSATPGAGASSEAASASSALNAAAALSGAGALTGAASRLAQGESVLDVRPSVDLTDAADKLMSQVVQTIHTFQTAAGPALEARISDPNLGDVRMVVTGRAGEIVQAQLVVRDRISADAITAAVARMRAAGDGLAGVSVTVRSEGGNSSTGGRAGGNAFEAAGWTAGSGYGAGSGPGANGSHGQASGNGEAAAAGTGTGGQPGSGEGSRATPRPSPVARPEPIRANQPSSKAPLPGGSSLDIRA